MQTTRTDTVGTQPFIGEDPYSSLSPQSPLTSSSGTGGQTLSLPTPAESPQENLTVGPANISSAPAISQTFHPGASISKHPQDIFLMSKDNIAFCVSSVVLNQASENHFAFLLSHPPSNNPVIRVEESSQVLNVMLHALYHLPLGNPPLEPIVAALDSFPTYGIDPKAFVKPSAPLHTLLTTYAVLYPMDIYVLAASHDFHDLAVSTSAYLLSFPLTKLTNELCDRIGPFYLNRLVQLHLQRIAELKSLLAIAPHPHLETSSCNFEDQRSVTRAWNLASTYLLWDPSADMPADDIRSTLHSLTNELSCEDCKKAVFARVKDIIAKWIMAKRTIA